MSEKKKSCPKPKYLAAFVKNRLTERSQKVVADHIVNCSVCSVIIESLKQSQANKSQKAENDTHPAMPLPSEPVNETVAPIAGDGNSPSNLPPATPAKKSYTVPVLATIGLLALLGAAAFAGKYFMGDSAIAKKDLSEATPPSVVGPLDNQEERKANVEEQDGEEKNTGVSEPTPPRGFVMGNLDADEPIKRIKVTLQAHPNGDDIDDVIDLHLGLGYPLRLMPFDGDDSDPAFAARPTDSSMTSGKPKIAAGKEHWFEFVQDSSSFGQDPLRTSTTLLKDTKISDISMIGYAAASDHDWMIGQYRIEINGKLFASNDTFDLGPKLVNSDFERKLSELIPRHDSLVQQVRDLESVVETGLASEADKLQLDDKENELRSVAMPIQRLGGQLLGHYPILVETDSRLYLPELNSHKVSTIRVSLDTSEVERPGSRNPIYFKVGGRKFLLASEVAPLSDLPQSQTFDISPADFYFSPVSRDTVKQFSIGMLGSHEPFAPVPDRAGLKHVIVEANGKKVYDSDSVQNDRVVLPQVTLVPPVHRDGSGGFVENEVQETEIHAWTPGLKIQQASTEKTANVSLWEEKNREGERLVASKSDEPPPLVPPYDIPGKTNTEPLPTTAIPPGVNSNSKSTASRSRPLPRTFPPIRVADNKSQPLAGAGRRLVDILLNNLANRLKQPVQLTTNTLPGNNGTAGNVPTNFNKPASRNQGKNDANSGNKSNAEEEPANGTSNGKENGKENSPAKPEQVPAPKQLQIAKVRLSPLQQLFLQDGMRPTIEWEVQNLDQVKSYEARLYGVLPHSDTAPILLAKSGPVAFLSIKKPAPDLSLFPKVTGQLPPVASQKFSRELSPIMLTQSNISPEERNRLYVQPEVIAFDANGQVIQTGVAGKGSLTPLFTRNSRTPPPMLIVRGYQVDGDGYDPPASSIPWNNFESEEANDGNSAWQLNDPTNAHTAVTFLPQRRCVGISCWNAPVNLRHTWVNENLDSNFRIVGHLGFINGPATVDNEVTVEIQVIVQKDSNNVMSLAPIDSTNNPQKYEVLRIDTTLPVTYSKSGAKDPLMLIDIPIALEKTFDEYNDDLNSGGTLNLAAHSKYEKSLPLGRIENGNVYLNLKVKSKHRNEKEAVGLFGMRLVRDVVQPASIPESESSPVKEAAGNQNPQMAFRSEEDTDTETSIEDFKILTYNTFLLDAPIGGAPNRVSRAKSIAKADLMKGMDVVILNEVFDRTPTIELKRGLLSEYKFQTPVVGRDDYLKNEFRYQRDNAGAITSVDGWDSHSGDGTDSVQNGGVIILSKWPIEEQHQHIFTDGCGSDELSDKGFAYVRINYNGSKVHIIGTHTQSASTDGDRWYSLLQECEASQPGFARGWFERQKQFREIAEFVANKKIPNDELLLIGGDLNVPGDTREYEDMLRILNVEPPTGYQGHATTWDPLTNRLIPDDESNQISERLDYIFVSKDHQMPSAWYNEVPTQTKISVVQPVNPSSLRLAWRETPNLSDHYPVFAGTKPELPEAKAVKMFSYSLAVKTGRMRDDDWPIWYQEAGGTDGDVSIQLESNDGQKSAWIDISSSRNDFQAGATDHYSVIAPFESVNSIRVKKTDSDDWMLSEISISSSTDKPASAKINQVIEGGRDYGPFRFR